MTRNGRRATDDSFAHVKERCRSAAVVCNVLSACQGCRRPGVDDSLQVPEVPNE